VSSWKAYADAYYKIYDAEIGYIAHRQFSMLGEDLSTAFFAMYNDPTKSMDHLEEFVNKPEVQKLADELRHFAFQIILVGMTRNDIEYQEKVLDKILADVGGHRVAGMSEPEMERFVLLYLLKLHSKHLNFVWAGGKYQYFRADGAPDYAVEYADWMIQLLKKYQDKGPLPKVGGDCLMGTLTGIGGGGDFHLEQFVAYNRSELDSINVTREMLEEARKQAEVTMPGLAPATGGLGGEALQAALAAAPRAVRFYWQWKIKQMLDPNNIGDPMGYPVVKEPPKEE
jgi:hypothetical protein